MTDFTPIIRGPWRIRTSAVGDDHAAVVYATDSKSQVVGVETHTDLALLRDAITEYLETVEATR